MQPYENWKVRIDPVGARFYHYGTEEEITKELDWGYNDYIRFVPQCDWTASDWAQICANELENANRHSFVNLPYNLLCSLHNHEYSKEACTEIMRLLAFEIWDSI